MRKRYRLHIINSSMSFPVRSVQHGLEQVVERCREGETWSVSCRVGQGDEVTVRQGVGSASAQAALEQYARSVSMAESGTHRG